MASQIKSVSKDKVADWAALDANVFLFNKFHQIWVEGKMETMTNSLCSEQNSVVKLCVGFIVSFSAMKIKREFLSHSFSFVDSIDNLWHERI